MKFSYNPEWIAILKITQEEIPLEKANYSFFHLSKDDEEMTGRINAERSKIKDSDLEIKFKYDEVYSKYEVINP